MQFTSLALSALSIGSALAATTTSSAMVSMSTGQITVHVVKVGNANGSLAYSPNNIKANVGDMVQFQFAPNNHTVTQSTFAQPCQPIAMNMPGTIGFYSGFMPVTAATETTPTYTIMINNTMPIWLYCSQGMHCQKGMVAVINENPATNKTLAAFKALAAQATVNLPGGATSGGTSGSSGGTGSTGSTGSTSGTAGTSSSSSNGAGASGSPTTSAGSAKSTTSGSSALRVSMGFGSFVAAVAVLLL